MQRVPRERPTSSAVLAQLGPFTEAPAGPAGEHSYLPEAAMALIGQYQRSPLLASGQLDPKSPSTPGHGDDATSASYTELPASYKPAPKRRPAAPAPTRPGRASWPAAGRQWVKTHMAWVGWVTVGAALVVGGVILGASLSSSGSPGPPIPPAPQTVCGTSQAAPGPGLCMVRQSQGTAATAFTVQGNDFTAGSSVTFTVSEADPGGNSLFSATSPRNVTVRPDGTFQVAVSQLYSGPLSLGLVTVDASAPGGAHASTEFMIIPSGPPPGGGPPPAG
jgi:hypothetical protein